MKGVLHGRMDMAGPITAKLLHIYRLMEDALGDRGWWPAKTREEVVIGAILVQNVSWKNTVIAIERLRERGWLTFPELYRAPVEEIAACVRSTRFYVSKAKKLHAFAAHVCTRYGGRLDPMFDQPLEALREELLGLYGIGPETADDIVLYAAGKPTFVVDAYTRRIFARLGLLREDMPYEAVRRWFMDHLPADTRLFNQYHALIDAVGHHFCTARKPRCSACPLRSVCGYAANLS
ncbi:endonuclease III [Alicyclobacillus cellulosilyticus]|uniref:Endonuclease III n=2 Tax=Alicyclobacillus cellulosilyticus TaxID=1003997 RepID=A0A917NEZ5_9BACL|nr:endonuclease III [Alicyclobacillus cellulosilyticus]